MRKCEPVRKAIAAVLYATAVISVPQAYGYEEATHDAMSVKALGASMIDEVLRSSLRIDQGVRARVDGRPLEDWVAQGAVNEDRLARSLNHFHDPTRADWSQAGLGRSVGQSSALWAQNTGLSGWSWQDVRQSFFDALTKERKQDRDAALARTFEGLGRQIHLVQDAASPAHTRNDPHVFANYETFVERTRQASEATFLSWLFGPADTAGAPDAAWRSLDAHPLAPTPTARLIDTSRYVGANPALTTEPLIGLAEYASANFFSEDRIFTENDLNPQRRFPYPRYASASELGPPVEITLADGRRALRRYYVKARDGAVGYRLAAVSLLRSYLDGAGLDWRNFRQGPTLDEHVYGDYARRLLPRALSYSTALLDYFVRGEVAADGDTLAMSIANRGPEAVDGSVTLYYDDASGVRRPVPQATWAVALPPGGSLADLRVTAPSSPPPKDAERYTVVFRGAMGGEADAVAGAEAFIPSVVVVEVTKRSDGTPWAGAAVKTIDTLTGESLGEGLADSAGRARLRWRPGRTALFLKTQRFPIYWGGPGIHRSALAQAKVLRAEDTGADGVLRVVVPKIETDWPERTSDCTGYALLTLRRGISSDFLLLGPDRYEFWQAMYFVNRATFTRSGDEEAVVICGPEVVACNRNADHLLVAEDLDRIGSVIGSLEIDSWAVHSRQIIAIEPDGSPGLPLEYICSEYPEEVEVVPVTVVER